MSVAQFASTGKMPITCPIGGILACGNFNLAILVSGTIGKGSHNGALPGADADRDW